MTVKELIEELKKAPQYVPVCVNCFIDDADEIDVMWQIKNGEIKAVVLK